jgi:5-methylcytosine-specific restriction enzyme subunit McrC
MAKIPSIVIKNVYYMLTYAFQTLNFKQYEDLSKVNFDDMYSMFSAILSKGIGMQLKQGLYKEYINKQEDLSTLRGKINLQGSMRNMMKQNNKLTCEYDELSENNLMNQVLKSVSLLLIQNKDVQKEYKDTLRKEMLFFSNVDVVDLFTVKWSSFRFQRNNQNYRMLISVCQLIVEGMLLTEDNGNYHLASFIDEQRMSHLYEKFILEYYKKHHPELEANASEIKWQLDDDCKTMLPTMKSDIYLKKDNTVLIIDAKYYGHNTQVQFDKHTVHSHNLYQIFTYVKNEDVRLKDMNYTVSGMLLYAKTTEEIQPNSVFQMSGNQISVRTLDLNKEFDDIKEQLEEIVQKHFS